MLLKLPSHQLSQVPWLMIPSDNINETHCRFFSILENKMYSLEIPELRWRYYFPWENSTFHILTEKFGFGDHTSLTKMTQFAPSLPRNFPLRFSLVRMISGEFFMVGKIHQWDKFTHPVLSSFYKRVAFEVYKFDQRDLKWKEVKNIGDNVFFLCMNNSLSLSTQSFVGCKADWIYFTDDYIEAQSEGIQGGHDMGVYNMGNGSVEPFRGYASDTNLVWPPPIWVFPNPGP